MLHGKPEREDRSVPGPALARQGASKKLGVTPADREAEPRAPGPTSEGVTGLPERLEGVVPVFGLDAAARVRDGQDDARFLGCRIEPDLTA